MQTSTEKQMLRRSCRLWCHAALKHMAQAYAALKHMAQAYAALKHMAQAYAGCKDKCRLPGQSSPSQAQQIQSPQTMKVLSLQLSINFSTALYEPGQIPQVSRRSQRTDIPTDSVLWACRI